MKDGAVCFVEIPVARHALQLAPGLATGMPIGTDVATAKPAVIGTIRIGTKVSLGVDGAPAASGEGDHRGGATRVPWGVHQPSAHRPRKAVCGSDR